MGLHRTFNQKAIKMNAVYKKDAGSEDGSLSPGLSKEDEEMGDQSSLVDILIQNSKPNLHGQRTSSSIALDPSSSSRALAHDDNELVYMPPSFQEEFSSRQLSKKSSNRHSGSFAQLQREKAARQKQDQIDNFMARQNQFEKRKERNLKKLKKDVHKKDGSITTPRQAGGQSARKQQSARGSHSKKKQNHSAYDSFDGVKDGVANKMHCDPHSTTSHMALQTINFPGANPATMPTIDGMHQYLTVMNTHPLLQTAMTNNNQQFINPQLQPNAPSPMQMMQQYPMQQQADYYQSMPPGTVADGGLPRPYVHNRNVSGGSGGGRPLPPHLAGATSAAMAAAVCGEEVLDEFPVPTNVHVAPRMTDISIEQRSFLQMQNAINQSSRLDEMALHEAQQNIQDSQNVTNIMMQALGGHEYSQHQNLQMIQTPLNHHQLVNGGNRPQHMGEFMQAEKFFGAPVQKPSDMPSRIGSRLPSYQVSHSQIPPMASQANLETTQVMRLGSVGKQPSFKQIGLNCSQSKNAHSSSQQFMIMQNALGEQPLYDGRTKDIDILDSEFAQEESRQIEAYYISVNKESNEKLTSSRGSMHQPRKSSIRSSRRKNKRMQSPPAKGYKKTGQQNRSMTEKKLISGVRVGVSRLDQANRDENTSQFENRSQISKSSQRSARQVNAKAVAQARNHLQRMQVQRREVEAKKAFEDRKKKQVKEQAKNMRDELYLSNKLTRQFIMVTSLVMQSEDLSEDSIFNYAQYTEFAIRFGLMSERAASEESDERALLYEMWCTLSRVHSDFAFVRVVNLKTMITAILGFPIAIHKNPIEIEERKRAAKLRQQQQRQKLLAKQLQLQGQKQNEEEQQQQSEEDDFRDADCDDVPTENNFHDSRNDSGRASRQPFNVERSAGKASRDTLIGGMTTQSYESLNIRMQGSSKMFMTQSQQRPTSIIDEYDELRAAENGQLSSPEPSQPPLRGSSHQRHDKQNNQDDSEEQQYFFDRGENGEQGEESNGGINSDESSQDSGAEGEGEETVNEYAIDRAHKIGFFVDHFEFCMSMKDVSTVRRRFTLFKKNWVEFQKKDLVVKKSVIVDEGVTFQPKINKKSEKLIQEKESGNLEFPISNNTRNDQRSQRRQKIWERDLPRGVKSKERIHSIDELGGDANLGRGEWLTRTTEQTSSSGLPFGHNMNSREMLSRGGNCLEGAITSKNQNKYNDYFALGAKNQQFNTFATLSSTGKSSTARKGPKGLTTPQLSSRMEQIYSIGKAKIMNRQDADQDSKDFEKSVEDCTFRPQISQSSRQLSSGNQRRGNNDKPWQTSRPPERQQQTQAQHQQLAERMQMSIQKDIQRKKQAQMQKKIKDEVIKHGGWPKDVEKQMLAQEQQAIAAAASQQEFQPNFKNYFNKKPISSQKQTPKDSKMGGQSQFKRAESQELFANQRYPMTSQTSKQNLHGEQQQQQQQQQQQEYFEANNAFQSARNELGQCSEPSTPVNEFSVENHLQQRAIQQPTQTHHSSRQPSSGLAREQTPNRGMGAALQHSTDEQGRAPLESQSSLNKTNEKSIAQSLSEEGNSQMTNIMTANQAQMLQMQKAVEDLTVIQETTFEQTMKGQHGAAGSEFGGASSSIRKPLLFIEVDTNGAEDGGIERIEVYKGDDPKQLAQDFCRKHDYDEGTQIVLQRQIEEKLARAYAKLDAKMQEKRQNRLAEKFRARQAERASQ